MKALCAKILKEQGYRIDTEVSKDGVGEIDIVAYGQARPIIVEVESNLDDETIDDKLRRYYEGEPFRDVFVLDPTEMPDNRQQARVWIQEQL